MPATLKPSQCAAIREDLDSAKQSLTDPAMSSFIQDKAAMQKRVRDMEKTLDEQAPRPFEASELDAASKLERQLREKMQEGMPTEQEMHRNRNGSVRKHMKWESANKKTIMQWREVVKRLNHDSDDPELTSYERFRPSQTFGYDTTAQIPGVHAFSEEAKRNWPEDMHTPTATTAISHLEAAGKGEMKRNPKK